MSKQLLKVMTGKNANKLSILDSFSTLFVRFSATRGHYKSAHIMFQIREHKDKQKHIFTQFY